MQCEVHREISACHVLNVTAGSSAQGYLFVKWQHDKELVLKCFQLRSGAKASRCLITQRLGKMKFKLKQTWACEVGDQMHCVKLETGWNLWWKCDQKQRLWMRSRTIEYLDKLYERKKCQIYVSMCEDATRHQSKFQVSSLLPANLNQAMAVKLLEELAKWIKWTATDDGPQDMTVEDRWQREGSRGA